jgi:hypothetical protein
MEALSTSITETDFYKTTMRYITESTPSCSPPWESEISQNLNVFSFLFSAHLIYLIWSLIFGEEYKLRCFWCGFLQSLVVSRLIQIFSSALFSWSWVAQRQEDFSSNLFPDWLWGPPSLLSNGYWGSFPGGKVRPRRHVDHSPRYIAEVVNEQEPYLLSPLRRHWCFVGLLFSPLSYTFNVFKLSTASNSESSVTWTVLHISYVPRHVHHNLSVSHYQNIQRRMRHVITTKNYDCWIGISIICPLSKNVSDVSKKMSDWNKYYMSIIQNRFRRFKKCPIGTSIICPSTKTFQESVRL